MAILNKVMHRKNSSGTYDTYYFKTSSSIVVRPNGHTVETDLAALETKTYYDSNIILANDTVSALEIASGSSVGTALTTMKSTMAEYKVGDIRISALQLNNDWISLGSTTNPYKLANNVYDPTIHPQLFNVLFDSASGLQDVYTGSTITSTYNYGSNYYWIGFCYLNNAKILLYYNTTNSIWCIRKYINNSNPANSSNYIEYNIPGTSTYGTSGANSSDGISITYVNGKYFLKLFDKTNYLYKLKYSYDLQTWYDYIGNDTDYRGTPNIAINLPRYCNGYYYYIVVNSLDYTKWDIHYSTTFNGAYSVSTLNIPNSGTIMSDIYYINGKYYMLVGYNLNASLTFTTYLYESLTINSGYTTNYNKTFNATSGYPSAYTGFNVSNRSTLVNNNIWIIEYDINCSNKSDSANVCICSFDLSTVINTFVTYSSATTITLYTKIEQVTDKYIFYSITPSQKNPNNSYYEYKCIIVKLENFNIKVFNLINSGVSLTPHIVISDNACSTAAFHNTSTGNISLVESSFVFPALLWNGGVSVGITDIFYIKGK